MDRYKCFSDLNKHETEFKDYRIRVRQGPSGSVILAPHGGRIERGTSQVADAVAGQEHSFYSFEGLKTGFKSNWVLHLTSNRFDEPKAVAMVHRAQRVITIHGARGMKPAVYLGGLDRELREKLRESCRLGGLWACDDPSPTRQGLGPTNICNRGMTGKGLQVELTFGLRKQLFDWQPEDSSWHPTQKFNDLVQCFRAIL